MNPIWYEFLRSFISTTVETTGHNPDGVVDIIAGNGLVGGGTVSEDVTLAVGAGLGITVNANDVNVDISSQQLVDITNEDEILFSDVSDNNNLRKTRVRDINALANHPGGLDTQIQYNDEGVFGGDSGFTTDGNGNAKLQNSLSVNDVVTIKNETVGTIRFDNTTGSSNPRIQSGGAGGYTLYSKVSGSLQGSLSFNTSAPWMNMTFSGSNGINFNDGAFSQSGVQFVGHVPLRRCVLDAVTASTSHSQGNGPLTGDYNFVNTVANDNDTVTLPAALSGRYCLVRNNGAKILQVFPASGGDLGFGTNVSTTIRPGAHFAWIAVSTTAWHQTDGLLRHTVGSGITASTTQTQGQQPLTNDVNEISTVANANDTVTLPSAPAYSRTITIINDGANTLQIFPASGDNLGSGVNTATTLASGSNIRFTNYDATNWKQI